MSVTLHNPPGLPAPEVYRQVAVATGTRTVYVAGQVARTADGTPVGAGDLAVQVEQAYRNVATALAGVGGDFSDVVKLTVYVVDYTPERMGALVEGVMRTGITATPPITLIGVTALGEPDMLVEVEATAVLD
ncbi:RidA family protein [Actinomycetospora sp. CA-084318]|uniref:RidA family protein n=1 Tax=Actinomycetospora sp. CA-084318 TaxID=3239892 RepID=UPI003D9799F8